MNKEAALFKVLADPTRLRLAILLAIKGETCVCMLADGLDMEPSGHGATTIPLRTPGMSGRNGYAEK